MKDAYTKLMLQQHTSKDAVFYEKLENTTGKKKHGPVWKSALAAACILLLIPVTAWAAETIFGVTLIEYLEGPDFRGIDSVGYQLQVDNVENIPITEFSPYLQELEETELAYFNTWEEAEQAIGIEFLDNPILTDENTNPMKSFYTGKNPHLAHVQGNYQALDGQLFSVILKAQYYRNRVGFWVSANMTTDNPQMTEELFQIYHGYSERHYPSSKTDGFTVEQYTTENGIPVTIVWPENGYSMPEAYFSVNNVSYHVDISRYETYTNKETKEMAVARVYDLLKEVLEGFTLE